MSGEDEQGDGYEGYEDFDRLALDRSGQAEAFDHIGDRYDDAFPHKEGQLDAGRWLAETLPPGSRVLDVGCGTGLPTARQLVDAGHEVVGIDISPGMLKLARDNVPEATFHHVDIVDLRVGGRYGPGGSRELGPFDGIAAYFSLLLLPRPEIPYALRTLHAALRPGGCWGWAWWRRTSTTSPFRSSATRSGYPVICGTSCARSSAMRASRSPGRTRTRTPRPARTYHPRSSSI
ncbi:hypothetical protein SVIO_068690 [Streptomyces violaceusniger]|uniref:Methyltransferase domain-containing protein n=1 Tax=Streptomyces violaceusniger TaxID=68280 RepID=A0A4D4LAL5_STRVO|nr:hypothetical protein SVIO_068690 [Streptomyces violaceusniger]